MNAALARQQATMRRLMMTPETLGRMHRARIGGLTACACSSRGIAPRTMGAVGAMGSSYDLTTPAGFSAQVQASLKAQSASVQQQIAAETGVDTTDARVGQGATAAASLAENGYNPDNQGDNDKLVAAIAGGACLIPGVGPLLGGAVEGLYLTGKIAACPVINAFNAIGIGGGSPGCGAPPCKSSGPSTPGDVLSHLKHLPAMAKGSFAELAVGSLAFFAAQNANCKGGVPPAAIVDALVAMWNKTHQGPAVGYWIPALDVAPSGNLAAPAPAPELFASAANVSDKKTGNVDPNIFYAFQPAASIASKEGFTSVGTGYGQRPASFNAAQNWAPFLISGGFFGSTIPRIVLLNSGALIPPAAPAPKKQLALHLGPAPAKKQLALHLGPSGGTSAKASAPAAAAPMSTGGKVAAGVGVAGAGALAWWLAANKWKWVTPRWARRVMR
jgi:hypothetical protein